MRLPHTHVLFVLIMLCWYPCAGVEAGRLCLPRGEAEVYTSTLTSLSQVYNIFIHYTSTGCVAIGINDIQWVNPNFQFPSKVQQRPQPDDHLLHVVNWLNTLQFSILYTLTTNTTICSFLPVAPLAVVCLSSLGILLLQPTLTSSLLLVECINSLMERYWQGRLSQAIKYRLQGGRLHSSTLMWA